MSGLAFAQAPPPSHPLRFLIASLIWGTLSGAWVIGHGDALFASRWHPATVALVHMFALGMLGNAMIGSLYQFLPVAAGSPLRLAGSAVIVHVLLNLGLILLLACFLHPSAPLAVAASGLLGLALLAIIAQGWLALLRGSGVRATRVGIALALACLLMTWLLGGRLLAVLTGHSGAALDRLANLHADVGVVGWGLGLLVSVGSITLPMLQGARAPGARSLPIWWVLAIGALLATAHATWRPDADALRLTLALPVLALCVAVAWLQARAPRPRNPTLRRFWASAAAALTMATIVALSPLSGSAAVNPAGVLALALALPWFVIGMLLEIVSFLAWIELRRRHPRGVRVPGVDRLFAESAKHRLWGLHLAAGLLLVASSWLPELARAAGTALAMAYALTLFAVLRCWREVRRFQPPSSPPPPA